MHIVFFSDNYVPESNPAANRVSERAKFWVEAGHDVTVIASFPNFPEGKVFPGYKNKFAGDIEFIDGVKVLRCWSFMSPNKGFFLRLVDFISFSFVSFFRCLFSVKSADVICVTSPQFFQALAAALAAYFKRVPFVLEISDLWPDAVSELGVVTNNKLLKPFYWLEMRLYKFATGIIVLTSAYKTNLVNRGIDPRKISVIRNGADLRLVGHAKRDVALHKSLGFEGKFVFGFIGTLGIAQNLSNAVAAFRELERRGNDKIALLIIGAGGEKQIIRAAIEQAPKSSNIVMLDAIPRSEVEKYTSTIDVSLIHLRNSKSNTTVIPSKVFEAMGTGKPILLVAPKGEAQKIVQYRQVGVFIEDGNPVQLADELERLAVASAELEEYSKNCLKAAPLHTRKLQAEYYLSAIKVAVSRAHKQLLGTTREKNSKSEFELTSDPITEMIESMTESEAAA